MHISKVLLATSLIFFGLTLSACSAKNSYMMNDDDTEPETLMMDEETQKAETQMVEDTASTVSTSTEVDVLDKELEETVILDEDFSDL